MTTRGLRIGFLAWSFAMAACVPDSNAKNGAKAEVNGAPAAGSAVPAAKSHGGVAASEIEIVEHTVIKPAHGKDDKESYWIQFQIFGEMKNKSNRTLRIIAADVTYYDAAGKMIDVSSIATEAKKDARIQVPGDPVHGAVHHVPPGGTVPFHYTRNLAAIKGDWVTHKITPRVAAAVDDAPVGVAVGVKEAVGEMTNPALPNSNVVTRRRAFEGQIRNDGVGGCRDPKLVVGFYENGKLKHLESIDAKTQDNHKLVLGRGQSAPFKGVVSVSYDDAWREKAAVKTWVDCEAPY